MAQLAFRADMAAQSTSLPDGVVLRWRGPLLDAEMTDLVASYGGTPVPGWWNTIRPHSFGWATARAADDVVVGFVNIVTDGGDHGFLVTRRRAAPSSGAASPPAWSRSRPSTPGRPAASGCTSTSTTLRAFYLEACGFEPTAAGLIHLRPSQAPA